MGSLSSSVYQQQVANYDAEAGGGLFATDEPIVAEDLSGRKPGVSLDAACGTGRFAEFLARRGHRVIGIESSRACSPPQLLSTPSSRRQPAGSLR